MEKETGKANSIKYWAEDDRPREKLLRKGINSLSDAELIAVLIGSGSRNLSAVELSKQILTSAENNLNELGKFTIQDLKKHRGIGEAKAISIVAAMELGRRRKAQEVLRRKVIGSSEHVYDLVGTFLSDLPHEEFWLLCLNAKNALVRQQQIGVGGINSTVSDIRKILRIALESKAVSIVVCHNHPSGSLQASQSDIQLTDKLQQACKVMDINLLDHLIVSSAGYYSFADMGVL